MLREVMRYLAWRFTSSSDAIASCKVNIAIATRATPDRGEETGRPQRRFQGGLSLNTAWIFRLTREEHRKLGCVKVSAGTGEGS